MASTMTSTVFTGRSPVITKAAPTQSRLVVRMAAANRPTWCPGLKPPAHLTGELAGDFGYDPLGLGKNPESLKWYVQSEIVHGRWAMAGLAGMLIPNALTKAGILNVPDWFVAGKVANDESSIPFNALLMVELFLMGWVETKRWMDFRNPQSQGAPGSFLGLEGFFKGTGENGYPGGIFDPLGFGKGAGYKDLKVKEIKNGRLAMLACLGFFAQAIATGKGPVDNWLDHLADPWANNFTTNHVSVPFL